MQKINKQNRIKMKTSDLILLRLVIGLFSAIFILVLASRIYLMVTGYDLKNNRSTKGEEELYGIVSEQDYQFTDFDNISISGSWKVNITRGNRYSIEIVTTDQIRRYLKIEKKNNTLSLGLKKGANFQDVDIQAKIIMPEIKSVSLSGRTEVELYDFISSHLKIYSAGVCTIKGEKNKIENLNLNSSGVTMVDLKESRTVNARISVSGAGNIVLTMDGGELTGHVRGAANVVYYGKAGNNSIRTYGVASIRHKN